LQHNRPGAEVVFEHELDELTKKLAAISPRSPLGVSDGAARGKPIRRVLLWKSQQHVFYSIEESTGSIVIRSIWGARRGRRPRL
jgi:hypothetical protein